MRSIILFVFCCAASVSVDACLTTRADFLYWQAKQQGLYYATAPASVLTTTDFSQGRLLAPHPEWEGGFRFCADYAWDACPWTVGAHLTYFRGRAQSFRTAAFDEGIFPVLSFAPDTLPTDEVHGAEADWVLHTVLLDILGSSCWWERGCLSVNASLAVRNAWIDQNLRAVYTGDTFSAGPDAVRFHSRCYGIGPRVGIRPVYALGCGMSLYGEAAGALLYSKFNARQKETFLSTTRASLERSFDGVRGNVDLSAGLSWDLTQECGVSSFAAFGFDFLYFSEQFAFKKGAQFSWSGWNEALLLYGLHVSCGMRF